MRGGRTPTRAHVRERDPRSARLPHAPRLVDAGELGWDDPVTKHLPGFRLGREEYVWRALTLRDLMAHRSGLAEGTRTDGTTW